MGTGCFKVPDTMALGHYIGQWYWEFNKGQPYTTCFDFTVAAKSGATAGGGGTTGVADTKDMPCANNVLKFGGQAAAAPAAPRAPDSDPGGGGTATPAPPAQPQQQCADPNDGKTSDGTLCSKQKELKNCGEPWMVTHCCATCFDCAAGCGMQPPVAATPAPAAGGQGARGVTVARAPPLASTKRTTTQRPTSELDTGLNVFSFDVYPDKIESIAPGSQILIAARHSVQVGRSLVVQLVTTDDVVLGTVTKNLGAATDLGPTQKGSVALAVPLSTKPPCGVGSVILRGSIIPTDKLATNLPLAYEEYRQVHTLGFSAEVQAARSEGAGPSPDPTDDRFGLGFLVGWLVTSLLVGAVWHVRTHGFALPGASSGRAKKNDPPQRAQQNYDPPQRPSAPVSAPAPRARPPPPTRNAGEATC